MQQTLRITRAKTQHQGSKEERIQGGYKSKLRLLMLRLAKRRTRRFFPKVVLRLALFSGIDNGPKGLLDSPTDSMDLEIVAQAFPGSVLEADISAG